MAWYDFTWFYFVIIGIVAFSVIVSFFRGILRELVSLITWVVALLLALRFAQVLGNDIAEHFASPMIRYVIGFVIVFLAVLVVGLIVNTVLKFLVEKAGMGFFDRFFGAIFGAARGLIAVVIVLMFLHVSPAKNSAWLENSKLAPLFKPAVTWVNSYLPDQIKQMSEWLKTYSRGAT